MKTKPIDSFWSLVRVSAYFGAKAGLVLAAIYVVFTIITVFAIGISMGSFRENSISSYGFGTILFVVIGVIVGIIPSIIVGTITALTISTVLWSIKRWLSALLSIVVGLAICYGFVKLVDYAVWPGDVHGIAYYSWNGLPKIIYILTGGFMSWKLFNTIAGKSNERELATDDFDTRVDVPPQ